MKWFELIWCFRKEAMFWLILVMLSIMGIDGISLSDGVGGVAHFSWFGWTSFWATVVVVIRFILMFNNWRAVDGYKFDQWKSKLGSNPTRGIKKG